MDIRILTFNIHKGVGWGVKRNTLDLIYQQICALDADIIYLQEVRSSQIDLFTSEIWPHVGYGKNAVYRKEHHGNAILSKFPILSSHNLDLSVRKYERRGMLHCVTQLSAHSEKIHLLCVHLGLLAKDRHKQLDKMIKYIELHIPETENLILAGDFNDWTGFVTKPLFHQLNLHEAFVSAHGRYARTFPAWAPILKLDRVYSRGFVIKHAQRLAKKPWKFLSDHIALDIILTPNN